MAVRVSVRVNPRETERLLRAVGTLGAPALYRPVTRFLEAAALIVLDNAAREQIIGGGRVKSGVGPRGGKRLVSTPPHPTRLTSRSGELRRSLGQENSGRGIDRSGLPRWIDVGSDLQYAPVHELGLRGYPVRAFLKPAVAAVEPRFERLLFFQLEKELAAQGVEA